MTTMRVIVDEMLAPDPSGIARYTEELTRALIEFAPAGCVVEGIVSASTEAEYDALAERLPGLGTLYKTSLARRELVAAWQHGFTRLPGGGMVHAPGLLAPLGRHDRRDGSGHQVAVTVHDVAAWTHPDTLPPKRVAWQRAMVKRAYRYADAVVVPSHAVGDALRDVVDFGDRVRVIGSAAGSRLGLPADADARAARLALPPRYLLTTGGLESQSAVRYLLAALALPGSTGLPLLVLGPDDIDGRTVAEAAADAGLAEGRVTALGDLSDADRSVVLDRVRVIGSAAGARLGLPADADARAARLALPQRYLLTTGGLESQSAVRHLLAALALPGSTGLPLLVLGPDDIDGRTVAEAAADAGLAEGRVTVLGDLSDADRSVVLDRAAVLVYPSLAEGFGLGILEAFHFATPVVHSDAAALAELAADAGLSVAGDDLDGYPSRLAAAVSAVVDDPEYAARLGTYGQDRAGLFSWRSSAENVWQLHADL